MCRALPPKCLLGDVPMPHTVLALAADIRLQILSLRTFSTGLLPSTAIVGTMTENGSYPGTHPISGVDCAAGNVGEAGPGNACRTSVASRCLVTSGVVVVAMSMV